MNIVELKDNKTVPDIVHEYTEDIRSSDTPLIIDNGSYQCRVGWTTQRQPLLIFKNLIAKPRKERVRKDGEPPVTPPIQIGNDIVNIEAVRFQLKTQFDKNVVTHFEAQEQILDYAFSHLGIENEGSIPHPIVMTEAFLNPNYSRNLMSELLFECYGIPALSYGVDALFSFYYNQPGLTPNSVVNQDSKHSGLIVSCGYHTTHVIPILYGKCYPEHTRRINLGGFHLATYLHRLLQLKYPVHVNAISLSRVEELLHGHCSIALDYQEQLKAWTAAEHYEKNVKKVQLPFVQPVVSVGLTAEQRGERRKELARRLTEMNARRREERLAEDEDRLSRLRDVLAYVHAGYDIDEVEGCEDLEVKTSDDVEKAIIVHQARIERTRQKMAAALAGGPGTPGGILEDQETSKQALPMLPPSGLELSEWIESTKKRRTVILERRTARKQRRTDMARRRTAAAQERMRIISQLARKEKGTDDFGMRDEDWDVYKTISKEGGDSDSEVENEKLIELEDILRQFDPSFDENTMASRQMTSGIQNSDTLGEAHQLHVGVEAIRTPELLFQPSMTGSMEAGLAETIEYVLKQFDSESQLKLAENVFLTGGCASFPGLKERLSRELMQMRPFKSFHKVTIARDPNLDAWNGARSLGLDPRGSFVTRSDYEEMGGEYLKEHYASNQYHKSPGSIAVEDV